MPLIETRLGTLFYAPSRLGQAGAAPIILIHGAGSSHLGWPMALRRLAGCNVYALDLPAHGKSGGQAQRVIKGYAEAVAEFLSAMALPPAILIGHSMGGAIAQTLALDFSAQVAGLVLLGTGAQLQVNERILHGLQEDAQPTLALINQWCWAPDAPDNLKNAALEQLQKTDSTITYADYLACSAFDVRDRLPQIHQPTLVIGASRDKMTPLTFSKFLASHIPQAQLVTIEGGGHMMMLEQADAVSTAIGVWLAQRDKQ